MIVPIILILLALLSISSAAIPPASAPTTQPLTDGRLTLPSIGISIPVPHGWVADPERTGSIGMFSLSSWIEPTATGSTKATTAITILAVSPKLRPEIPPEVVLEPGPRIDGKPSTHVTHIPPLRRNGPNWFACGGADGYRIAAHGFDFYFILYGAMNPHATAVLQSVVTEIRWSKPIPAYQCLALNGRRVPLLPASGLSFEIPDPFWKNPFRCVYSIQSLANDADSADADFQVEAIKDSKDAEAALAAAAKMPLYYGQFDPKPQWRTLSLDPEIHISKMARISPASGQGGSYVKLIVAKSP